MILFGETLSVPVVSPGSPVLPTDGLSVDDLDPSSPERAAGRAPLPPSGGFSWGWRWRGSSESSAPGCCSLWQLSGRPLDDVAQRLASCGWEHYKVFTFLYYGHCGGIILTTIVGKFSHFLTESYVCSVQNNGQQTVKIYNGVLGLCWSFYFHNRVIISQRKSCKSKRKKGILNIFTTSTVTVYTVHCRNSQENRCVL